MKTHALTLTAVLGLVLITVPLAAVARSGPAFDCAKATHEIEALICQDDELAARDRQMADVYQQAIRALEAVDAGGADEIKMLKTMQRGWIGGRNACWKAADKRQCTIDSYARRTAYIQARYFLVEGGKPVPFTCKGNPANEIVATFIPTKPPSVRLERGDSVEIGIVRSTVSGSGTRYDGDFGRYFWVDGDTAQVAWPQDKTFNCIKSK